MTSNTLINSVKRRAGLPDNQSTFEVSDYLAFANEEISLGLLPTILRLHEDYLLYSEEIPLVASKSNYKVPYRAIGNKLREISMKDSAGNITEMTRINIGDLPDYLSNGGLNRLQAFYVKNNEIVLVPEVSASITGSLVMSYYLRPNDLVEESRAGVITDINTSTGVITLKSFPTVFTTTNSIGTTQKYDFIKSQSPNNIMSFDIDVVSVDSTTNTITFAAADLPSDLEKGDYVNLATESIVPQIPTDLHVVLAHRVAMRCLESLGDTEALQNASAKLGEMEQNTPTLIDNRVENAPRKVINRQSLFRSGAFRRFTNRG